MKRKKVLVVEDDLAIRKSLEEILEIEGYRPILAENGKKAFELLKDGEAPCVILLDLMMPVMTGWEFLQARKLSKSISEIPVIVVSAAGDRTQTASANQVLNKPIDIDRLLEVVDYYCTSEAA